MSWSRALLCWLVAAAIGALWLADLRRDAGRGAVLVPHASESAAGVSLPRQPRLVELRRGDTLVAWERTGEGRWRVTAPAGRAIPAGLLDAFVEQLAALANAERLDGNASDPAFGLVGSTLLVATVGEDGRRAEIRIGDRTPTGTAAYARLEPGGPVLLVGLNLLYYADLLFDTAR